MNTGNLPQNSIVIAWNTSAMHQFAMDATSMQLVPVFSVATATSQDILAKDRARELERLTKNGHSEGSPDEYLGYPLMSFMLVLGVIFLLRRLLVS